VPVDISPPPQLAVNKALELAQTLGCLSGTMSLLHVGPPEEPFPPVRIPEPGWTASELRVEGDIVEEVHSAAARADADVIAVVTHGREGFLDALRGSTTERIVRSADRPVLAVSLP
jgi:nucleotide-binding universal stress UspA family protein